MPFDGGCYDPEPSPSPFPRWLTNSVYLASALIMCGLIGLLVRWLS